ncbi:MAG TPA: hypothetical protein VKW70_06775 [Terriglobia bacterium]|nr:hypothetical protein [Terriglobia bacterium]
MELEALRFGDFTLCSVLFSVSALADPLLRRVLESLCCAMLKGEGFELLNDTLDKRQRKKIEAEIHNLSAEELVSWLQKMGLRRR